MHFETTSQTGAGIDRVWEALTDITSWPRWITSVTSVERLDDGPLRVGSRARVRQPGMPALVWEVTELRAPEVFTWTTRSPGVLTVGDHRLTAGADGTTHIRLTVGQSGPLAGLVRALTGSRTRRYMGREAAGLKACAEEAEHGGP